MQLFKIVKHIFITLFLLLILGLTGKSQTNYPFYETPYNIEPLDSNTLFFEINNNNFIKNNEYFGNVATGYTLLGFNLAPTFVFIPNNKIKWGLGVNLLAYYSRTDKSEVQPLLSFQYKVNNHFDFILGSIHGNINHKLIEPLYDFERFLSNNTEYGVQFLWNSEKIYADLWLDWEQQIFQDDPFQEMFNVGLSSYFTIFEKEDNYKITLPFQNLIRHEGGQINSNDEIPLKTIFNNATGLSFSKSLKSKYLHKLIFSSYWVNYQDLSPNKRQMYVDGMGSYTTLELRNTTFDLLAGFWYGEQFIAPLGNPVFETYSRTRFYVEEPVRQIITAKLNYHKKITEGSTLGLRFDSYYDILGSYMEYSWSILVIVDERFFIKNIKLK